jgi:CSLREA domain-containing protein
MFRKFLTLMTAMTLLLGSTTPFVAPAAANSEPMVSFDSAAAPNAAIVVNDLGDALGTCAGSGSGACTLRDAITYANATAGADVITFAASGIITLTGTLPPISDTLTLDGTGQIITISGASAYQVMIVNPAQPVTLNSLTIANGYCLS